MLLKSGRTRPMGGTMSRFAASLVVIFVLLSSLAPVPARAASACTGDLTYAGLGDIGSRRYDGVTARVKPTSRFSGLNGKLDSVAGLVGIGDPTRSYVAIALGSQVDGDQVGPS